MTNIPTDSPVLQSLQPCLIDLVDSKESEILYSNEFSGIGVVSMSPELKEVIDSDFGEVGPNLLTQLQKKMRAVPGGPWYIDSRDGCIYIHNRNFKDIPLYTYSYKANSGELLDISFKTNYVTKRTSGGLLSGVDHDKNINTEVVFSNLDMETLKSDNWPEARQVAHDKELEERSQRINSGQYDQETRYGQNYVSMRDAEVWYRSGGMARVNARANEARVKAYLDAMSVPELQREVTPILEQVATNRGIDVSQLREELKTAMVGGNLETYLKKIFGNSMHTFNAPDPYHPTGGYPNTFQVYEIDLFNFDYGEFTPTHGVGYGETFSTNSITFDANYAQPDKQDIIKQGGLERVPYAKEALQKKYRNRVVILEEGQLTNRLTDTESEWWSTITTETYRYSYKVKILVETQSNSFVAPTWRLVLDLYTRQISPEATAKDVEAHVRSLVQANAETVEKVLTCHMTCIGNPFLESSQILTLNNLGKIWSGKWYIKTCKHNLSTNGYTCQLTLIENRLKVNSTALNTQVKADKPWDGEEVYDFLLNVTPEEARYYATEATSDEDKVELLLRIITSRKANNADHWNEYGIVRVTSNTSTTGEGDDVGVVYSIDSGAPSVSEEVRELYELPARAAVVNNNLTDIMEQITKENESNQ